jgi:hypothetical protein
MEKHRGFPSRLPGTDYHFTLRRPAKGTPTRLAARERYADRRPSDRKADEGFLWALWNHFGEEPFVRGNLDAGRLSWFFGREIVAVEDDFDPESYEALLRINVDLAFANFPDVMSGNWSP